MAPHRGRLHGHRPQLLPRARVLAESFFEHHPGASFTVLVIDDTGEGALSGEPFHVLSPYDIGLPHAEIHRMAFTYDVKAFATAVKPWLLGRLPRGPRGRSLLRPGHPGIRAARQHLDAREASRNRPDAAYDGTLAARRPAPGRRDAPPGRDLQPWIRARRLDPKGSSPRSGSTTLRSAAIARSRLHSTSVATALAISSSRDFASCGSSSSVSRWTLRSPTRSRSCRLGAGSRVTRCPAPRHNEPRCQIDH
jgi:hypothetical protein